MITYKYLRMMSNWKLFLLNNDDEEDDSSIFIPKDCIQVEFLFTKENHANNLLEKVSV
jgi:hypothetical protein